VANSNMLTHFFSNSFLVAGNSTTKPTGKPTKPASTSKFNIPSHIPGCKSKNMLPYTNCGGHNSSFLTYNNWNTLWVYATYLPCFETHWNTIVFVVIFRQC
jgi:hypothetical protein